MIKIINEAKNLEGKKVLVRVGINVPLNKKNEIVSDFRLKKIMETINFLVEKKAKIILMGHIGREKKENLIPVFQ
ncbi:MAG TPA: phosphoglycerate kinase [Candidatus Pacebacteria bacterium]|nr:phosphoglycerate kinase [Candidatus Paceibacterota bacterium]HIP33482.1 phosphoglycerate kinase [Bacteroidia bacterium]